MDRKTKRLVKRICLCIAALLSVVLVMMGGKLYLKRIDALAAEYEDGESTVYVSRNDIVNPEGLYESNIKENLESYLEDKSAEQVTYKFPNESFQLVLSVVRSDEGMRFVVDRVVDEGQEVNAMVNFGDVESIVYKTGNANSSTIIGIKTSYKTYYVAITSGTHYLLGEDIETISYKDNQFYYLSYNLKYTSLREASSCSKEVKEEIDKFNPKDYYYKYGSINFLRDFYQKLASKSFSVQERCDELEALNKEEKVEEE